MAQGSWFVFLITSSPIGTTQKGADEAILNNIGATCREVTGGGGVTARDEQGDL